MYNGYISPNMKRLALGMKQINPSGYITAPKIRTCVLMSLFSYILHKVVIKVIYYGNHMITFN